MLYFIQVRKDEDSRGLIENSKHKISEKDWSTREESYTSLDDAIAEARSVIERNVHLARNVRVASVVAEFETRLIIEEIPPS